MSSVIFLFNPVLAYFMLCKCSCAKFPHRCLLLIMIGHHLMCIFYLWYILYTNYITILLISNIKPHKCWVIYIWVLWSVYVFNFWLTDAHEFELLPTRDLAKENHLRTFIDAWFQQNFVSLVKNLDLIKQRSRYYFFNIIEEVEVVVVIHASYFVFDLKSLQRWCLYWGW